jgi:hypothetical protein
MDITQDTRYWKAFIEQRLNDFDRQRILNLLANDADYADAFRAFEIEYNLAKKQWIQEFSTSEPETQPDTIPSNHLLKWAAPLGATVVLLTAGVGVWNYYHPELPTPTPTREIPATNSIPDSTLGDKAYAQSDRDTGQTGSDAHSKSNGVPSQSVTGGQPNVPKKQVPKDTLKQYQAQLLAGLIRDEKLKSNGLGNVPKGLSFDKQLQELYKQKAYKDIVQQTDTLPATDRSLSNFMRALALYRLGGQTNLKEALDFSVFGK